MNTKNPELQAAVSSILQHLNLVEEQNPKPRLTEAQRKKRKYGQAKNIPDAVMLMVIRNLKTVPKVFPGYAFYMDSNTVSMYEIQTLWSYIPPKIIQAKLNRMIERGLVDGCACGCSTGFRLERKGEAILALYEAGQKQNWVCKVATIQ